tara:strand:+ start:143 stop:394 length:252 start_codon:yes stop_codon:yes gene_type:complete
MNKKTTGGFNNLHAALTTIAQHGRLLTGAQKLEVREKELEAAHEQMEEENEELQSLLMDARAEIERLKVHTADLQGQLIGEML